MDVPFWVPIVVAVIAALPQIAGLLRQRKDDADPATSSGTIESLASVIDHMRKDLDECRRARETQ